jgi:hypothetical protein
LAFRNHGLRLTDHLCRKPEWSKRKPGQQLNSHRECDRDLGYGRQHAAGASLIQRYYDRHYGIAYSLLYGDAVHRYRRSRYNDAEIRTYWGKLTASVLNNTSR